GARRVLMKQPNSKAILRAGSLASSARKRETCYGSNHRNTPVPSRIAAKEPPCQSARNFGFWPQDALSSRRYARRFSLRRASRLQSSATSRSASCCFPALQLFSPISVVTKDALAFFGD